MQRGEDMVPFPADMATPKLLLDTGVSSGVAMAPGTYASTPALRVTFETAQLVRETHQANTREHHHRRHHPERAAKEV